MPSTRRAVLLGAAGTLAALAGCNETTSDDYPTVTPVDVPQSRSEALKQAAAIGWPQLPPAVPVTDARLDPAMAHAEALVSDLRTAAENNPDMDLSGFRRALPDDPNDIVERAASELQSAREADRDGAALHRVESTIREVSLALGYMEAKTGTLDRAAIETMLDDEQEALNALTERFSYRIAEPIGDHLPALYEAEQQLTNLRHLDHAREQLESIPDGEIDEHTAFALARQNLEINRRNREAVATLHDTATDPNAPSFRAAIPPVLADLREEVEAIADTYADREPPTDATTKGRILNIRIHVGRRSTRWLRELDENGGEPSVRLLVEVVMWLTEFDALDAAVGRTADQFENGEVPAESVIEAKEDAADGMEAVAAGTPLQRHLADRGETLLETADRIAASEANERSVARTHLFYAGAAEWARRSVSRGSDLVAALEAQQS